MGNLRGKKKGGQSSWEMDRGFVDQNIHADYFIAGSKRCAAGAQREGKISRLGGEAGLGHREIDTSGQHHGLTGGWGEKLLN